MMNEMFLKPNFQAKQNREGSHTHSEKHKAKRKKAWPKRLPMAEGNNAKVNNITQ